MKKSICTKKPNLYFNILFISFIALNTSPQGFASPQATSEWSKHFKTPDSNSLNLAVSYVWSGQEIKEHNVNTLKGFRKSFPNVPIIHFISASYFARGDNKGKNNATLIKQTMIEGDRVGILLAGWKSEMKQSGIIFRNSPTFWGTQLSQSQCLHDCGLEVPLTVYSKEEADKLVKNAKAALLTHNFGYPIAIKIEGFLSSFDIMEVAIENEIFLDFTTTNPQLTEKKLRPYPLNEWVKQTWNDLQARDVPFEAKIRNKKILVIPQSIGTIDYASAQEIGDIFRGYLDSYEKNREKELKLGTIAMSIHQSTAFNEMPKLIQSLKNIYYNSKLSGYALIPLALPGNTLTKNGLSEATIDLKSMKVLEPAMYPEFKDRFEIHSH